MSTTARQFAAELEQAGCRITWDDYYTDSEFAVSIRRGRQTRGLWVVFYHDGGSQFWYAQSGAPGRYMGGERLRSMKAVREHLGLPVPSPSGARLPGRPGSTTRHPATRPNQSEGVDMTTTETIHLRQQYAKSIACGITGPVRITTRASETTCPRCMYDGDPVPRTRAIKVEAAHTDALG